MNWKILCDTPELAAECAHLVSALSLTAQVSVHDDPVSAAILDATTETPLAIATHTPPTPRTLVRLHSALPTSSRLLMVICGIGDERARARDLACDLGLATVEELGGLMSMIALIQTGREPAWVASVRSLDSLMRARLGDCIIMGDRGAPLIERADAGLLQWREADDPILLGQPRDVRAAALALRAASGPKRPPMPAVEGVERDLVLETLFGPPRALSDPASKGVLSTYDIPLPTEELCTSPSRASAEAARIGFPVRISLASPDLRVWDHPDLSADAIDNATSVRDVFRQFMAMARQRAPEARLLGVTVSASEAMHASLGLRFSPLPNGDVLTEIGFGDPHGIASDDRTLTILPGTPEHVERALMRLRGHELILGGSTRERRRIVASLTEELLRIAAFAHDWRQHINAITINPLALLVGGEVEAREACIEVNDTFLRGFEAPLEYTSP